jgi:hypothetical protein
LFTVFSLIQNAQNISYLIPVEKSNFLNDVKDGVYDKPQTDLIRRLKTTLCGAG